jgi:hypothetical protein
MLPPSSSLTTKILHTNKKDAYDKFKLILKKLLILLLLLLLHY